MKVRQWIGIGVIAVILGLWVFIGLLFVWWNIREPPAFSADPALALSTWTAIAPGSSIKTQHNSNTDLIFFKGSFLLIHAQTLWHLEDKNGALLVQRSADAKNWEQIARITLPGTDVRDPKFAVIRGRLFLYFLPNKAFDPSPRTTYWSVSDDGVSWQQPREVEGIRIRQSVNGVKTIISAKGWNLWRPKTFDGKTWYVMASGRKADYGNGITVLLRSEDGVLWEEVSEVYTVFGNGEPELEFLADGRIIAVLRCGGMGTPGYEFGNATANTIIATAYPPYVEWSFGHSFITRLDGSTLFSVGDRVFAAGRNHLGPRKDLGSHLSVKRTAIYEVKRDRLVFICNLPSNGDTAYTGVVVRGDDVYVSYYTCPIDKEYPWIAGICFQPRTEIRMAKMSASGLASYAESIARPPAEKGGS